MRRAPGSGRASSWHPAWTRAATDCTGRTERGCSDGSTQVIEFKTATLAGLRALPTTDLRFLTIDLRRDWPAAFRQSGFIPTQPAAWIAEGLLAFLPADAQDRLFDELTALSAPGSRVATETFRWPSGR